MFIYEYFIDFIGLNHGFEVAPAADVAIADKDLGNKFDLFPATAIHFTRGRTFGLSLWIVIERLLATLDAKHEGFI